MLDLDAIVASQAQPALSATAAAAESVTAQPEAKADLVRVKPEAPAPSPLEEPAPTPILVHPAIEPPPTVRAEAPVAHVEPAARAVPPVPSTEPAYGSPRDLGAMIAEAAAVIHPETISAARPPQEAGAEEPETPTVSRSFTPRVLMPRSPVKETPPAPEPPAPARPVAAAALPVKPPTAAPPAPPATPVRQPEEPRPAPAAAPQPATPAPVHQPAPPPAPAAVPMPVTPAPVVSSPEPRETPAEAPASVPDELSGEVERRRLRVLVVDDDDDIRQVVAFTLKKLVIPVDIVQAMDGQEAVEMADAHPPDLVVLDIMMPRMDGFETCARLRQNVRTAFVPILMLTASADETSRSKGYLVGTDDYMSKPFQPLDLKLRVTRLIRRTYGL